MAFSTSYKQTLRGHGILSYFEVQNELKVSCTSLEFAVILFSNIE